MTKCQHCHADILSTSQPNVWTQQDIDEAKAEAKIMYDYFHPPSQPNRMGTTPEMQKMYDEFGGEEPVTVQEALRECASRCRYDGDLFHDQQNEMRRDASWKAADMATSALAATPGGEITDAMLNAAAIEWTRMCHGYPYSNEGVKWSEFFGRMFKAAALAQPASPLRGEAMKRIKAVCEDNAPASCNHKMALDFVLQIATADLASRSEAA